MKRQLSTKDWELLSSYLDGELNPREKARVEVLLSAQPDYKEALDGLRRTKSILHRAPVRKVPHNFTLTAADVQPVKTSGLAAYHAVVIGGSGIGGGVLICLPVGARTIRCQGNFNR